MRDKLISILLTFFIFVIVRPAGAGDVKSIQSTSNQETTIKVDENRIVFQKSKAPAKQPVSSLKKIVHELQPAHSDPPTDRGAMTGTAIFCVDFLKAIEETKKFRLTDSLHKVIYSSDVFHDPWKERVVSSAETNETDSPNSNLSHSILRLDQNPSGDRYLEGGNTGSTLRLIQLKREEIFNEIFMGFRFTFGARNKPMFVEMNISPFPEKGPGLTIAF